MVAWLCILCHDALVDVVLVLNFPPRATYYQPAVLSCCVFSSVKPRKSHYRTNQSPPHIIFQAFTKRRSNSRDKSSPHERSHSPSPLEIVIPPSPTSPLAESTRPCRPHRQMASSDTKTDEPPAYVDLSNNSNTPRTPRLIYVSSTTSSFGGQGITISSNDGLPPTVSSLPRDPYTTSAFLPHPDATQLQPVPVSYFRPPPSPRGTSPSTRIRRVSRSTQPHNAKITPLCSRSPSSVSAAASPSQHTRSSTQRPRRSSIRRIRACSAALIPK